MKPLTEKRQPHPTVRMAVTLAELAACAVLLLFPTMRLSYAEALSTEVTTAYFLADTAWELPVQLIQIVFWAVLAAAVASLFIKRIDRFVMCVVLASAAGLSFASNAAVYITCLFTIADRTYYGLVPQLSLTTAGQLYTILGVFSFAEAVCACLAFRPSKRQADDEEPTDE